MNGWRSPRPNSLQIYGTDPLDRNVFQDHEFAPADVTDRPLAMPTDDVQRPAGDVQRPVGPDTSWSRYLSMCRDLLVSETN